MSFIQNLFTSRDNNANSATYVGQQDRLWWDPVTNQFYYSNGNTPGGFPVGGGSGGGNSIVNGSTSVAIPVGNGNVAITINGVANTVVFSTDNTAFAGNLIPAIGNTYSLGNITNPWDSLYISGNTIYLGNVVLEASGNALVIDGNVVTPDGGNVVYDAISATGNVTVNGTISSAGNITGNYFIGNGSQLTGVSASAANIFNTIVANTVPLVADSPNDTVTLTPGNNIIITGDAATDTATFAVSDAPVFSGNVTANYFVGNASALTSVMADRGADLNNWNAMTQMGVYTVNRTSWSGTTGTPLDSQVYVGLVEVKNSTNTALAQVFYPGTVDSGNVKIQWNRTYWSGSWTAWIKIINDEQVVVGGTY